MGDAKFTPGPWAVADSGGSPLVVVKETAAPVASVRWLGQTFGSLKSRPEICAQIVANASLIAAAPELYAALEALVEAECDYMLRNNLGNPEEQHNVKVARAALAKARGEA